MGESEIREKRIARKPSKTAMICAFIRAVDARDGKICGDYWAERFLNPGVRLAVRIGLLRRISTVAHGLIFPGWITGIALRSRYIDDVLKQHLEQGIDQVVILGAGYDSRALRFGPELSDTQAFEVDTGVMIERKNEYVMKELGRLPSQIRYCVLDLERAGLKDTLLENGFKPGQKTLYIAEGLVMYLDRAAVRTLLDDLRSLSGPGSAIVFDTLPGIHRERMGLAGWFQNPAWLGEPYKFLQDPEDIDAFLKESGYEVLESPDVFELNNRYLEPDRRITSIYSAVHASTGKDGLTSSS